MLNCIRLDIDLTLHLPAFVAHPLPQGWYEVRIAPAPDLAT